MGVYTYKISRKSRKVDDIPTGQDCVYLAEFGYKLGYYEDDAVMHRKYVAPTVRAWDKYFLKNFPMTAADIYFVMDFEDGAEIYKRNNAVNKAPRQHLMMNKSKPWLKTYQKN